MRQSDITYTEKLNQLRMDVPHPNNRGQAFVLVEGDTDIRLYRKFFDLNITNVEQIPGGNPKVEACVATLQPISDLVIGIRDSDFIKIMEIEYAENPIFLTDYHDLEMSLIANEKTILAVVFDYTLLSSSHEQRAFVDKVFALTRDMSLIKLLNAENNWELSFKFGFLEFFDRQIERFDSSAFLERAIRKSDTISINIKQNILELLANKREESQERYFLTNGHDFVKVFTHLLRKKYGHNKLNERTIEDVLRIKYSLSEFKTTSLYEKIMTWQLEKQIEILL